MTSERRFYGWKLIFFLWLLDFLNIGFPLYGGAVINTYMLREISMSRSAFGLGFSILNFFAGTSSILVGASIVRWGVRQTLAIGSALLLAGAHWLSLFASRPWHYWLGFGVLIATGINFGTVIPAATAVTRCIYAGLLLLFPRFLFGDSRLCRRALDRPRRSNSIWHCFRLDFHLPEHHYWPLLRTGGISESERNDAGTRGSILFARRVSGRQGL